MKNRNIVTLAVFISILTACAPKVILSGNSAGSLNGIVTPANQVTVLDIDNSSTIESTILSELVIKDGGLSTNCGYENIIEIAKEKAGSIGGNLVLITEHTPPGVKSTCHQIKANIYNVDDPEFYLTELEWSRERMLRIEDFQGSTADRPFTAATVSGITYNYHAAPYSKVLTVKVWTYFDKKLSYFKRGDGENYVLRHEQVHFDISELYARKFISRVKEELSTLNSWNQNHENIYKQVREELYLEQDKYDSEVYADTSLQTGWTNRINQELEKLNEFDGVRKIEIPKK